MKGKTGMKKNIFNLKANLALSLIVVMLLSFASCSGNSNNTAFLDQISEAEAYSEDDVSIEESSEPPTADGYTARPIVTHLKNKEPYSVVVAGTCEAGSTIKAYNVAAKEEVYETKAIGNYFIFEVKLSNTNEHYYEISATVEGKKESTVNHFTAQYNAVAEKPANGTAVSIGKDSHLFYDSLIPSYKGDNLLTNTELKNFKANLQSATNKEAIKYVYVMIPEVLSVYNEIIPEDISKNNFNTKFTQLINAISESKNADVIDLTETFIANKNGDYPLYYNTSSNLSDYGTYLAYKAIIDYISKDFDQAALEYTFDKVSGKGGDLASSLGLDETIFAEDYFYAKKPSTTIGENAEMSCPINDILVYANKETNALYTDNADPAIFGAGESLFFKTNRPELPSAVFVRDNSANSIVSMLAEHFNNSFFETTGSMSLTNSTITGAVSSYATENKPYVDYVFVIVSEDNIDSIING